MNTTIYTLDPDPDALALCQETLASLHLSCQVVEEMEALRDAPLHSLVFLPLKKIGLHGISELRGQMPALELAVIGATNTIAEATEVMRRGALDYLKRPLAEAEIRRAAGLWQRRVEMLADSTNLSERITLLELGRTLTSTLELDELYEQIIEQVNRAFQPDSVSLMLLNEQTQRLRLVAQRGLPDSALTGTEVPLDGSIAGKVATEGRPQLLLGGLQGTEFRTLARRNNIGSSMSIPLIVKGRTLGVVNVTRHKGRPNYTENQANLLHIFAAQIAIAVQNARLYESLRDERDRIVEAQEEVRRELARDLHDGLTQVLATVAINLDHLRANLQAGKINDKRLEEELVFIRGAARQAVQDARTLTFGLRPLVLETQGLHAALQQYLTAVRESDRRTTFHLEGERCPMIASLPTTRARMVFAILQEAINNARKHAQAENIRVTLACESVREEEFLLHASVRDDGAGFDLGQVEGSYDERYSFGLHNMKERATIIDATLRMSSGSAGTTVDLVVPWKRKSRADNPPAREER